MNDEAQGEPLAFAIGQVGVPEHYALESAISATATGLDNDE